MGETDLCPCGSGRAYAACCGRYHQGEAAPTAEALMRSRYSAFALGLNDYLLTTWHRTTRPTELDVDPAVKWLGLELRRTEAGGTEDDVGVVEFVARCKVGGRAERLHESSRFRREAGRWYYVDGDLHSAKEKRR